MNFRCIYQHGFARVAACTSHVAIADPPANAEAVLPSGARVRATRASRSRVFPELCLSGYSIEDLLLQDAVLDGVEAALATVVEGSADLLPVLVVGAPLRHRNRVYNCAVVVHRGRRARRRAEVVPADLPRVLRAPPARAGRRPARRRSASAAPRCRSARTCCSRPSDVPGLVVHVEVCEDMWVPIPPSAEAALAGATVLLNLSGSPITDRPRRGPQAAVPLGVARAASPPTSTPRPGQGESTTDLSWDGQTMIYENGVLLAETERFPDGDRRVGRRRRPRPAAPGAHADGDVRRQPAHARRARRRVPHASRFTLDPPDGDLGLRRTVERFPFVPADPDRLAWTATRPTTSRSPGLAAAAARRSATRRSSSASPAASTRRTR